MMNQFQNMSEQQVKRMRRSSGGLTLIEILFALVVLLIGLTTIAAIFPLAAHVQNRAFDEIIADQVSKNAEAMILARGFSYSSLADEVYGSDDLGYDRAHWREGATGFRFGDTSGGVFPLGEDIAFWNPDAVGGSAGTGSNIAVPAEERWHLADRSYPSTIADPSQREFFWMAMFRDNNLSAWERDMIAYVFVMRSEPGTDYGQGESVHGNDPPTVPKVAFHRLGLYTDQMDGYHSKKMRLGSWALLQHFPSTIVPSDTEFKRAKHSGDVAKLPEARPVGKRFQSHDSWFREYNVTPGRIVNNRETQNRRESPLKRIRLVGGEFIRP